MPQLAVTRKGWENEHLATFLLSRISFVAHPITIADDIGSDYICTLFESRDDKGVTMLYPRNSFAIQIKSNSDKVPATNKIEYLRSLELPYFLGIMDQSSLRLSIYSGEYLPIMFPEYGIPTKLTLSPVKAIKGVKDGYCKVGSNNECTCRFPFVNEISAKDNQATIAKKGRLLNDLCSRMHANISSLTSKEYIFKLDPRDNVVILAGSGSARSFRNNFCLRLAEVFYNLEWILNAQPQKFSLSEFEIYERVYKELLLQGKEMPPILHTVYDRLEKVVPVNMSDEGAPTR